MTEIKGIIVPALTAFDEDGKINEEKTRNFVDYLIEKGVDGIAPCGSTSEFIAMTMEERKYVTEFVIDQVNGRVPVYPGTGHYSTALAIDLSTHAQEKGADGVMVILPYYMRPPKKDVPDHYRAISKAIDIPIILYNNPWFAGYEFTSFEIKELVDEGVIHSVKVAHGEPSRCHDLKYLCGDNLSVLYGHDYNLVEAFAGGADGLLTGLPNVVPDICKEVFTLVKEGKMDEAWETWDRVLPLVWYYIAWKKEKDVEQLPHFAAVFKGFLKAAGVDVGVPRKPVKPLTMEEMKKMEELVRKIYG
ncbi:MAG: dihydrodipicolinate synthase family protein [Firmicutes bacterium]|nr:dihydrodipicolinate synthase family protein [Bacillota bacterium]